MIAKRLVEAARELWDRISRRLVNKLILLFTTIIILVVVSLTVISYQMLQRESVNNSINSTTNNLLLVNRNMEDYLDGIEQLSLPHLKYDEIIGAIRNESNDYASRLYLENYLRNLFYSRNDVDAICIYLVNQNKYYSIYRENYNLTTHVTVDTKIPANSWYQEAMASSKNRAFQSLVEPGAETGYSIQTKSSYMAYHRVLRSIASREPQALLSLYITPAVKDEIIKDIPFNQGEHLLLLDVNNRPFHVDDREFYQRVMEGGLLDPIQNEQKRRFTLSDNNQRYLVVYDIGSQEGWKLVKPIPYSQIYAAATKTLSLSLLIGFAFLVLSVILVSFTSNAIIRPVKRLTHQMSRFTAGSFDAEAQVSGRDEIAYLTRHFNEMVKRTNDLINERYRMKLIEKNAILKALEAEINPHFLYNALQAISTKALKNGMFDIADMVDALAWTLRYCISGKDIVHAKEELQHIERYLILQKARFGSRLQVEYEWEESLMELQIPKLSIQTLVENSIKHALEKVSSDLLIIIKAQLTPTHAVISVSDNGPGIPDDRLKELLLSFEVEWDEWGDEHIGLKNLHTRLKLLYGDEAELVIETVQPGTKMLMLIPRGGSSHV